MGKTCLLMAYSGKPFDPVYAPTIFENYITEVDIGTKVVKLSLWDTAGTSSSAPPPPLRSFAVLGSTKLLGRLLLGGGGVLGGGLTATRSRCAGQEEYDRIRIMRYV